MGDRFRSRFGFACCTLAGFTFAALTARPYAGSWNDGSRLAAVEAIADHGTLAIDRSIFVDVPSETVQRFDAPYQADRRELIQHGTRDKLFIDGCYYSDKPYLVSIVMAGVYRSLQFVGLPTAASRPDLFCRAMTILTSALAFAISIGCVYQLGSLVGLPLVWRLGWLAGFAVCTVALTYTWHVNNHIMLLAVVSGVLLHTARLPHDNLLNRGDWLRLVWLGVLAGIGYNLDLGAGPILVGALLAYVVHRCRSVKAVAVVAVAASPLIVAHHIVNYGIGGVWKPVNAVSEFMHWPGSPFSEVNMTGYWRNQPGKMLVYALALLFGKHGFVGHNLALFLCIPAVVLLLRRQIRERAELLFGVAFCAGVWLMYALFSNNYGGACCSIRWFVPFLAPAYFTLALLLRDYPEYRGDFIVLSAWGGILGMIMWWQGPWINRMVPWFWQIQAAALVSWGSYRYVHFRRWRRRVIVTQIPIARAA